MGSSQRIVYLSGPQKNNQITMANQGLGKMHLDLYTSNSALTHKAKFWCNYVGALKGSQDLRAPDDRIIRSIHPSIVETLPEEFPDLPEANDRIHTIGYAYNPVHTEIYGTFRNNAK